eukprot:1902493-Pleurochrysis_carterae.AAC.1
MPEEDDGGSEGAPRRVACPPSQVRKVGQRLPLLFLRHRARRRRGTRFDAARSGRAGGLSNHNRLCFARTLLAQLFPKEKVSNVHAHTPKCA